QDLAVAFHDSGFDLAHFFVEQHFVRQLAVEDLLADLRHALWAERVGRARPAERRLRLLVGLQQRLLRPLGREPGVLLDAVDAFEYRPRRARSQGQHRFGIFHRLVHAFLLLENLLTRHRPLNTGVPAFSYVYKSKWVCEYTLPSFPERGK